MLERKINQLKDSLFKTLNSNEDFIYLYEILDSGIDNNIKEFLNAEVNWWIYEDRLLRKSNKSFNFQAFDTDEINKQIDLIYLNHAGFTIIELQNALEKAVKIRANYLLRPKNTLIWFVFMNEPTKLADEIVLKLKYFSDYSHILSGLTQWLSDVSTDNNIILRDIFEEKINEIEIDFIKYIDFNTFKETLNTIFDYFHLGDENEIMTIPLDAVKLFFNDKNLFYLSELLDAFCMKNNFTELSIELLEDFFRSNALNKMEADDVLSNNIISDNENIQMKDTDYEINSESNELTDDNLSEIIDENSDIKPVFAEFSNNPLSESINIKDFNDSLNDIDELNVDINLEELSTEDIDALFRNTNSEL